MTGPQVRAAGRIVLHRDKGKLQFIDAIPKVASGKILRRELKELEKARLTAQQ